MNPDPDANQDPELEFFAVLKHNLFFICNFLKNLFTTLQVKSLKAVIQNVGDLCMKKSPKKSFSLFIYNISAQF